MSNTCVGIYFYLSLTKDVWNGIRINSDAGIRCILTNSQIRHNFRNHSTTTTDRSDNTTANMNVKKN